MQFLFVLLSFFCVFLGKPVFSLEVEIAADFERLKGQKSRAILLLKNYTDDLNSDAPVKPKEITAKKIATILGEGKGVGGFNKTRKATAEEKRIIVQALDLAYQYYPLEDNDFFAASSSDAEIKKHQAILWGLSKTMSVKAVQRMYQQEQALAAESNIVFVTEPTSNEKSRKLERFADELAGLKDIRRTTSAQLCGRFDAAKGRYRDLIADKEELKVTVRSLISDSRLDRYDSALAISENLLDLIDSKSSFVQNVLVKTADDVELTNKQVVKILRTLSLNVDRHSMYNSSFFKVVNVHQYNPFTGSTSVAIRRPGGEASKFSPAVQDAIRGLSHVDYDIVIGTPFFRNDAEEAGPYLLRPHCWTDPGETGGAYNVSHNVGAGIFESAGVTIAGQVLDTMGAHGISTHGGVASPSNMPLSLPRRNLDPEELHSFVSVVKEGGKGVVTLHGVGGDFISEDIIKLASLMSGNITAGDLFLLMHYSPVLSSNPHFLKLLTEWLG